MNQVALTALRYLQSGAFYGGVNAREDGYDYTFVVKSIDEDIKREEESLALLRDVKVWLGNHYETVKDLV